MTVDVEKAYKLTTNWEIVKEPQVVIGLRRLSDGPDDEYYYLMCEMSWDHAGHMIQAEDVRVLDDGVVEIVERGNLTADEEPVVWRFEPLTMENWQEMKSLISAFDDYAMVAKDDDSLQRFYREECLTDEVRDSARV